MISLKSIGKKHTKESRISLWKDIIHYTPFTKSNTISVVDSLEDLQKIELTAQESHAVKYKGQPLVKWYPNKSQLTSGYNYITTSKNVVRFHAAVLKKFPNVTVGSNYRTSAQQQALVDRFGIYDPATNKGAAPVGTSKHESGVAIDYSVPEDTYYTKLYSDFKNYIRSNIHPEANVLAENNTGRIHVHMAFPPTVTVGLKTRSIGEEEVGC